MAQELDNKRGIAVSLDALGRVAQLQGNCERARALYKECLNLRIELKNEPGITYSLDGFAGLAAVQGQARLGALLFEAAEALLEVTGVRLEPVVLAERNHNVAYVRTQLEGWTSE